MGLFDKLKKNKNEKKEEEINTSGWDAIDELCRKVYPDQLNPKHYAPLFKYRFGGNDPLDGISVYDAKDYWHFITYGLTELYEKESDDKEVSGFGMELTFKLKKDHYEDEESEIKCICSILQTIARITYNNGEVFEPYEYIYTRQTAGIDSQQKSNITGFITIPDDKFTEINTPNGKVHFVQLIGATDNELKALYEKRITVKELVGKLESDRTDYHRQSVL